jgi:hypothetical protein
VVAEKAGAGLSRILEEIKKDCRIILIFPGLCG